MDSENHTFLQVVRIPHGELWYSRDSDLIYSQEGDVQILYSQALNQFILRLHDFKVILDKSVHIISAIVGRHQRQAYLLPRGIGFTMIRLADGKSFPALENFETLLENTSSFSRGSGLDSTLANFHEMKQSTGLASSLLSSMSKAFTPSVNDSHPNQKIKRTFEQLLDIDSQGVSVVDLSGAELASLSKKNELDNAGSEQSDLWKSFMGQGTFAGFSKQSETNETNETKGMHQRTVDMPQPEEQSGNTDMNITPMTHKYHPSIDCQEAVGLQEQRLPSYEVQHSKEFLRRNLRKASANIDSAELGSGDEKLEENVELPEPVHFEDEAFTIGLLTRDVSKVSSVGTDKDFPVCNADTFKDLTHPMRKLSFVDRPFLEEHEEAESDKPKAEGHKGFHGQPILTAKAPTLKSNIDDQPSPIPNTEKYSEPTQPEKSSFAKTSDNGNGRELSSDTQPVKPSALGQQNIVRQSSQDNETKKQRKAVESVDKENLSAPTTV